ncbi:Uncharacterised protein [Mycobacterium tuberculosis]|nr:Uncharacterised protein [Mycobacterium tuberculosis]
MGMRSSFKTDTINKTVYLWYSNNSCYLICKFYICVKVYGFTAKTSSLFQSFLI